MRDVKNNQQIATKILSGFMYRKIIPENAITNIARKILIRVIFFIKFKVAAFFEAIYRIPYIDSPRSTMAIETP